MKTKMRYFLFALIFISCYATVKADPVTIIGDTFALHYQNGTGNIADFLKTDLTQHPDIVAQQPFQPGNPNGYVTFMTFLQGTAGTLFQSEWIYDGQALGIDDYILPNDFGPDTAIVFGHQFPLSYTAKTAVLNLYFGGQTATYTFTVREPIPEPATVGLFGFGTAAIAFYIRRARQT